jgi:hypothetical protein
MNKNFNLSKMISNTYFDMPGELGDKLKLWETLNKILKNNGAVDIEALESVVNELKQDSIH